MRHGTVLTETRDGAVHKIWVVLAQGVEIAFQPLHDAGSKIFDDHVGFRYQAIKQGSALLGFQVYRNALFPGVLSRETDAHFGLITGRIRSQLTGQVSV